MSSRELERVDNDGQKKKEFKHSASIVQSLHSKYFALLSLSIKSFFKFYYFFFIFFSPALTSEIPGPQGLLFINRFHRGKNGREINIPLFPFLLCGGFFR